MRYLCWLLVLLVLPACTSSLDGDAAAASDARLASDAHVSAEEQPFVGTWTERSTEGSTIRIKILELRDDLTARLTIRTECTCCEAGVASGGIVMERSWRLQSNVLSVRGTDCTLIPRVCDIAPPSVSCASLASGSFTVMARLTSGPSGEEAVRLTDQQSVTAWQGFFFKTP